MPGQEEQDTCVVLNTEKISLPENGAGVSGIAIVQSPWDKFLITLEDFEGLLLACPNITYLGILIPGKCPWQEQDWEAFFQLITRHCKCLNSVLISGEYLKFNSGAWKDFHNKNLPHMDSIDIGFIDGFMLEDLQKIILGFPGLTRLTLSQFDFDGDTIARDIAANLKQLHILSFSEIGREHHELTDEGVDAIARGCRKLQKIDLSGNPGLTEKSLQSIAENCPNLNFLDWSGNQPPSELALARIISNARAFRCFHVESPPFRGEQQTPEIELLKAKFPRVCFEKDKAFCHQFGEMFGTI